MGRCLTILEVSQKQAYIFGSNKVEDNIVHSAVIASCLSPAYIAEVLQEKYDNSRNLVYSGGGHTILEFSDREAARDAVSILTERIYRDFDGLAVFAKTIDFQEGRTPQENLKSLTAELEKKKSIRRSSFHQVSYGIERVDVNTHKPVSKNESKAQTEIKKREYSETVKDYTPNGYNPVYKFEDLGGEKNKSNFIAVVHIDGNGMGKRVEDLYQLDQMKGDWSSVKKCLQEFSDGIDKDFKDAYHEMTEEVAESIRSGSLRGKLNLKKEGGKLFFPIRRIITAGDDICFVTEGRIGIECARILIEKLRKKENTIDKKKYTACAGVAIVHQKYPFFKAYELSESLCSNAKKSGAKLSEADDGRSVCSIDWHIEFGEIKDSIEELRKDYVADDGEILTCKPYIIAAEKNVYDNTEESRRYESFKRKMTAILAKEHEIGDGKLKQLRGVMKKGKVETENFITFYKLKDKIRTEPSFDVIELMDTFLSVNEE